jgi:hypothetical protein
MAERNVNFATGVAIPLAEAVELTLYGSVDADTSLASLPTVPVVGARTVRIRGTLVVTTATTGAVTIRCRQGQGIAGATVQAPVITAALPIGSAVPFEFVDAAPVLPALNYSITLLSAATAGVGNITAEIEEVN